MRKFIVLIVFVAVAFWAFKNDFFFSPEADDTSGPTEVEATGSVSPSPDGVDSIVQPTDSLAEEIDLLRKQVSKEDDDGTRLQLVHALLDHGDREMRSDGIGILRAVFRSGSDFSPVAAALLLKEDDGADLEVARYIVERGPDAAGYEQACFSLGSVAAANPEEESQLEAWKLLSAAYFGREEMKWRNEIRPQLDAIVGKWILSARSSSFSTMITVQPGDSLSKIARQNKVTVGSLEQLNGLRSDVIHPGQLLKALPGKYRIEVDKSDFRLDLILDDRFLRSFRIGHGRDGCTPIGEFVVNIRQKKPAWQPRDRAPVQYGDPENPLGERWLGFKPTPQYSGYGIHGTVKSETIGTEPSDGCVRLTDKDVIQLYPWVPPGTQVVVRE